MKNIHSLIEERASDLQMLSTQTEIDYDSDENLTLVPENYDNIIDDMRRRWNKVSELAEEISVLTGALADIDYWRNKYENTTYKQPDLNEVKKMNEDIDRQMARIENR